MLSVVEAVDNLESSDILVNNDNVGNRETAESVKRFWCKHEYLSSKRQVPRGMHCMVLHKSLLKRYSQVDPWTLLVSQSKSVYFRFSEKSCPQKMGD